ncbi:MAG: calcium/sodium antiporter [Acidobacteriota bacterium]
MSLTSLGLFAAGLVLLLLGAELLVRGASRLAVIFGLSPLVVGLTVVAWGTGSPELAVAVKAALAGRADLAVGNVVGSNIANILLIIGFTALVVPLKVSERVVRLDVPLMIGVSVLTLVFAFNGTLSTLEGLIFVALLTGYTSWTVRASRREQRAVALEYEREFGEKQAKALGGWQNVLLYAALVIAGLALLVTGSDWLVAGASAIAAALGFSELIVGLTIVALGTSLPELATSAVAAARGERDIAVGNAVGSNIFNLLAVLGITAVVSPGGIPVAEAALSIDIPIMIAVAVACLPVFFRGYLIDRWNGALFIALYIGYIAHLVLQGTEHSASSGFTGIMFFFVMPLVLLTLALIAWQGWRHR